MTSIRFILFIILTALLSMPVFAQSRYIARQGNASFYSKAPLEDIEAHNRKASGVLELEKREVAVSMRMRDFKFAKSLMEEHFNENYVESDKYPKATFKGSFTSTQPVDASAPGTYPVQIQGELTIHGVTRPLTTEGTIEVKNGQLLARTQFKVALKDFNIAIPRLVFKNIAEVVDVIIELPLERLSS